jgi:hypothetical protein
MSERDDERPRFHDSGELLQPGAAVMKGFFDHPELEIFEVAQTSVDQPC